MNRRTLYYASAIFCGIMAVFFFMIALSGLKTPNTHSYGPPDTTATADPSETTTRSENTESSTTVSTKPTQVYTGPIDFKSLQSENEDIYAWIKIPGTKVNYPVVQSATDDSYYLDHNSDKEYSLNGAIFSEKLYNSTDFTDAVTVLYGHNMASGEMFGDFQSLYWDREFLLENDDIYIYLPDREIRFEIFAALPYSRMHLLHYYQTEKEIPFTMLIEDIYATRTLSAVLIEERKPQFGDQVLVLSTCLSGDNRYRYLILGVCKK